MIRTLVKPDKQDISIKLPKNFIGKQVEVIAFTIEEAEAKDKTITHIASENVLAKDWLTPKEDQVWQSLVEPELNIMSLSYAEKSFATDWDINNQAENDYWNSF